MRASRACAGCPRQSTAQAGDQQHARSLRPVEELGAHPRAAAVRDFDPQFGKKADWNEGAMEVSFGSANGAAEETAVRWHGRLELSQRNHASGRSEDGTFFFTREPRQLVCLVRFRFTTGATKIVPNQSRKLGYGRWEAEIRELFRRPHHGGVREEPGPVGTTVGIRCERLPRAMAPNTSGPVCLHKSR